MLRRLFWPRGYIRLSHGGGTTGVAQVNDTHLHSELSRAYQGLEVTATLCNQEFGPQGCPRRPSEDCMAHLVAARRNERLHLRAAQGHTANLLTTALEGSEIT